MNDPRFDALIFDCDGVLVDSEVLAIRGEGRALAEFGLDYPPAEYVRRFVGLHDKAFFDALRADYREKHLKEAPETFEAQILEGRRRERHALTVVAGADRAMQTAKSRFGAVAVASSSRAEFLESKLKRMGLWDYAAPHVYSADLVERGKPAPDVFLYAAAQIDVAPARCLVLEDSENGVRAGCAAGMTVWGFLGGGHVFDGHGARLMEAGASGLVEDFEALLAALDAGVFHPQR